MANSHFSPLTSSYFIQHIKLLINQTSVCIFKQNLLCANCRHTSVFFMLLLFCPEERILADFEAHFILESFQSISFFDP